MRDRTSESPQRVLIASADLSRGLERELDCVVARVDDEPALWAHAREQHPDLVVLDVDFAEPLGGLRIAHALLEELGIRVIYLSAHADTEVVKRAKLTRPYGYLLKPVRAFDLSSCLELALHRVVTAAPRVAPPTVGLTSLTGRERDVLRLIAQGHSSKDIASKLTIAKPTVDTYRSRISEKLGAKSRADLVRIARATGLLD